MADDPTPQVEPFDHSDLLPFEDATDGTSSSRGSGEFLYVGDGLTAAQFSDYVESYNFGGTPPDFVVLHHTAIPGISLGGANLPGKALWDSGEQGKSEIDIYRMRQQRMLGLRNYYRDSLGWDRGPHLFIDDRWIWLMTPMYHWGIHAKEGNYVYEGGRMAHYSIGIEVVGYYENVQWPKPIADLVSHAVAVLKRKLNSFEYTYKKFGGGISSHRDYNKPQCPGKAISEDYYIRTLREGYERLISGGAQAQSQAPASSGVLTPQAPIVGPATGRKEQAIAFIKANLALDSEYKNDVEIIMSYYWTYAPAVGVDPFLAATQCIMETDSLKSAWAARPKRNPAGLGVRQEGGLSFGTWDAAVQAHVGQLLAFALRDDEASEAQRGLMRANPRHASIAANLRGVAKTISGLNNNWTADPEYAAKLVTRAEKIYAMG
jgi:hypothetical protein